MNPKINPRQDTSTLFSTLKYYLNPNDGRYEDLAKGNLARNIIKDLTAGLVVAMVAIPLAMGFAMASGLRPEQGIVGGAVAGLLGALFGGSKYQVYGPTAAYIPIIAGLMATYNHSFLVLTSIVAGAMLMLTGLSAQRQNRHAGATFHCGRFHHRHRGGHRLFANGRSVWLP